MNDSTKHTNPSQPEAAAARSGAMLGAIASDDAIFAARQEGATDLIGDFVDLGRHPLRGLGPPIRLWGITAVALKDEMPRGEQVRKT